MAKVILICGKICSGKSTYAEQLRIKERAAVLSVDEIMLACLNSRSVISMRNIRKIFKNIYLKNQQNLLKQESM